MYPRIEYEMTEADLEKILDACKPTVCIKIGDYTGGSPQENANRAWEELGNRMGFDAMTVSPIHGKGVRFFTAVPNETPQQQFERELREKEESKRAEIAKLEGEIKALEDRLTEILTP